MSVDVHHHSPPPSSAGVGAEAQRPNVRRRPDSMTYIPQQFAVPVHPTIARRNSDGHSLSGGERTLRAENTLRRKTPNGTLHAGYDASAEDATPPSKHQLLPFDNLRHPQTPTANGKRTFLQHERHQQRRNSGVTGSWSGQDWRDTPHPSSTNFPVMDSMLNQMPMQHFHTQQHFGRTVPSVIQPSFQHVGPTASGGQGDGLYGPYWYDGTYVPYRPTAIRDPRFYHHHHHHHHHHPQPSPNLDGSLPSSKLSHQTHAWQPPLPSPGPWAPIQHSTPFPGNQLAQIPATALTPPAHRPGLVNGALSNQGQYYPAAPMVPWTPDSAPQPPRLSVDAEYGPVSANGRQRDKTFAWALQQYRELISFIHYTRRQQQQTRPAHVPQPGGHRPNFFPKPPRQSSARSLSITGRPGTDSPHATPNEDHPISLQRADTAPEALQNGGHAPKPQTSLWSPSGLHFHDNDYMSRGSLDPQPRATTFPPNPHVQPVDKFRTLRRSSSFTVSPMQSPLPKDDTPPGRASTALYLMTQACQETDWQWVDGMHLGGCLAYGLGDYQKALRWYTKVLENDPKHLEATSNLAATLLALGQKQEAEQNWMKVVRAAPNHFEAVEHLVGLLCSGNRSKDAVRLIEYVERALRIPHNSDTLKVSDRQSECSSSTASRSPCISELSDNISYDFDADGDGFVVDWRDHAGSSEPGFGSSGFAIPGGDNGRILALIHARGNMLYGLGDNGGAARAFEEAVLIATGRTFDGVQGLVRHILSVVSAGRKQQSVNDGPAPPSNLAEPILLSPEQALATARLCFPHSGELPGLRHVQGGPQSLARKAVISTTSNSLLSLAKIFQDGMSNASRSVGVKPLAHSVRDILALYYLSLALQPSPSTANNVGILLASVQQAASPTTSHQRLDIPGVVPGSGIALALQYYNYGLQMDQHHAHLYTNLGSLLKDIGQLDAAITMYERAVKCDGKFDIALANLANAVKDKGRISDAITFYRRAVEVSPDFAEAVCGLANALNSVCGWHGRGGIAEDGGRRDQWHVDPSGMLLDARSSGATSSGWIKRVVDIVAKQLVDGEGWGMGTLSPAILDALMQQITILDDRSDGWDERERSLRRTLTSWSGKRWEGARVTRLVERATRRISWRRYRDTHVERKTRTPSSYDRPQLPPGLSVPSAPTVLPFHTFTCPMSAKQIRLISQRNGLRISVSTLRAPWLPKQVYPPPQPPSPNLRVGYISSDFNNHPLAHLMQSVFGLHNPKRVEAYCYATTASDNSVHRRQIQAEAPVFHDASGWSAERLVDQILLDGIHILVNLNGYTRGARNEVFAARPAPVQMSFMGFAGTLGAEWCDYLLADEMAVPLETLRPWRRNVDLEDQIGDDNCGSDDDDWVYGENIIYCRDTFFCCDHKQSAPDAKEPRLSWEEEQLRRWQMRKELFPQMSDNTIIFGNFNQLYKIEPTTFRTWLRILAKVPNSILWLLRFPDLGESHLLATAQKWAGAEVASRVVFTDVAPKHLHISRARICDLVLDTAECNAHTTAADVLWSGTPLLTLPRHAYKMCSRMAASILSGALPKTEAGARAAHALIATSEDDYEDKAVALGKAFAYVPGGQGVAHGRLVELRQMLFHARWTSALFDTHRWVRDLEDAYEIAWRRWVAGEGGDIFLRDVGPPLPPSSSSSSLRT